MKLATSDIAFRFALYLNRREADYFGASRDIRGMHAVLCSFNVNVFPKLCFGTPSSFQSAKSSH
jgi:hypothetical protein